MNKFNLDKLREIAEPRKLTRAEEMALKAYPRDEDRELNYRRANYRIAYERGYKQAEKDLALTWGDIQLIDTYILELAREEKKGKDWGDSEKFYTEVLRRFKEAKNDGNSTTHP